MNSNDTQYLGIRATALQTDAVGLLQALGQGNLRQAQRHLTAITVLAKLLQEYIAEKRLFGDEMPGPLEREELKEKINAHNSNHKSTNQTSTR